MNDGTEGANPVAVASMEGLGVTDERATTAKECLGVSRDVLDQEQADLYNEERALICWKLKTALVVAGTSEGEPEPRQGIRGLFRVVRRCNSLQLVVGNLLRLSVGWGERQQVRLPDRAEAATQPRVH